MIAALKAIIIRLSLAVYVCMGDLESNFLYSLNIGIQGTVDVDRHII